MNVLFFDVDVIPPIDDADPVGRRNITQPAVTPEVVEISSSGLVSVSFKPSLEPDTYASAVEKDMLVMFSQGPDDSRHSRPEISLDFTLISFDANGA